MKFDNKFNAIFYFVLQIILILIILCKVVLAVPEYSNYMDLTLSNGTTARWYFSNTLAEGAFSLDDKGLPVNYTSSTITAYRLNADGSTYATLQFRAFGQTLGYKLSTSNTTTYVTVTKMADYQGIVFYGHKDIWYWITISAIILMLFLIFLRRKK